MKVRETKLCGGCVYRKEGCLRRKNIANKVEEKGEFISEYMVLKSDLFKYVDSKYGCEDYKSNLFIIEDHINGIKRIKEKHNYSDVISNQIGSKVIINDKNSGYIVGPILSDVEVTINSNKELEVEEIMNVFILNIDQKKLIPIDDVKYKVVNQ